MHNASLYNYEHRPIAFPRKSTLRFCIACMENSAVFFFRIFHPYFAHSVVQFSFNTQACNSCVSVTEDTRFKVLRNSCFTNVFIAITMKLIRCHAMNIDNAYTDTAFHRWAYTDNDQFLWRSNLMASGRMEFHADSIMQHANFSFAIPNDTEMEEVKDLRHYDRAPKNLILLHGLTGTDTDWLYGGNAQWMAIQYNVNIFMPTTGNSFYLDHGYRGSNWCQYIGEELPEYIQKTFRVDMTKENTLIGGLSMGGYGAIHTSLAYPERFSACIALSSALLIHDLASSDPESTNSVVPQPMLRDIFGDISALKSTHMNPEYQYKALKEAGADIPLIYMAIGTEDALLPSNHRFRDFLEEEGAHFIYEEGPGVHNWVFWNEYLDRGLSKVLAPK